MEDGWEPVHPPAEANDEVLEQQEEDQQVPQDVNDEIQEQQEVDQQVPAEINAEIHGQEDQEQQVPEDVNAEIQEQEEQDEQVPQDVNDEIQEQDQQVPPDVSDEIQEQQEQDQQVHQNVNDEIEEQREQGQEVPVAINDEIQQRKRQRQWRRQQEQNRRQVPQQARFPPTKIYCLPGEVHFRLIKAIGNSENGVIPVYKAACIYECHEKTIMNADTYFALKLVENHPGTQDFDILDGRLERNFKLRRYRYPHLNLMGIIYNFQDLGIACIAFHCMDGSLRSLIRSRFPNGIRQDCIIMVLKQALEGLCYLHDHELVHEKISAGQIFYEFTHIRLSFAATVYDHGIDDDDNPAYLPVKSISTWASAPEVYNSQDAELNDPKTDIWMIGITALELAFGEAQIRNRGHLMSIVNKITKEHRLLPLRGDPFPLPWRLFIRLCEPYMDQSINSFEKFVCKCLATDPKTRPTARELLQSELFTKTTRDRNALCEIFK